MKPLVSRRSLSPFWVGRILPLLPMMVGQTCRFAQFSPPASAAMPVEPWGYALKNIAPLVRWKFGRRVRLRFTSARQGSASPTSAVEQRFCNSEWVFPLNFTTLDSIEFKTVSKRRNRNRNFQRVPSSASKKPQKHSYRIQKRDTTRGSDC
jgi:hypothetical protein